MSTPHCWCAAANAAQRFRPQPRRAAEHDRHHFRACCSGCLAGASKKVLKMSFRGFSASRSCRPSRCSSSGTTLCMRPSTRASAASTAPSRWPNPSTPRQRPSRAVSRSECIATALSDVHVLSGRPTNAAGTILAEEKRDRRYPQVPPHRRQCNNRLSIRMASGSRQMRSVLCLALALLPSSRSLLAGPRPMRHSGASRAPSAVVAMASNPMTIKSPRIAIEYCSRCNWMMRSAWTAQELLTTFNGTVGEVALIPNHRGRRRQYKSPLVRPQPALASLSRHRARLHARERRPGRSTERP